MLTLSSRRFLRIFRLFQLLPSIIAYEPLSEEGRSGGPVYREDVSPLLGGVVPSGALDWSRLLFNNLDSRGISIPDGFLLSNDRAPSDGVRSDERRIKVYSEARDQFVDSSYTVRNPVATRHVIRPRAPPGEPDGPFVHDIASIQAYFDNPSDEYYKNLVKLPGFIQDYQSSSPAPAVQAQGESELHYNKDESSKPYVPQHHHLYFPNQPPPQHEQSPPRFSQPDHTPHYEYGGNGMYFMGNAGNSEHNVGNGGNSGHYVGDGGSRPHHGNNGGDGGGRPNHVDYGGNSDPHVGNDAPSGHYVSKGGSSEEFENTTEAPTSGWDEGGTTASPTPADRFPFDLLEEIEREKFSAQIPQKGESTEAGTGTTPANETVEAEPEPIRIHEEQSASSNDGVRKEFHITEPIVESNGAAGAEDGYTKFKNALIDEIMTRLKQAAFEGTTHHIIVTILPPTKLLNLQKKQNGDLVRTVRSNQPSPRQRKRNQLSLILNSLVKSLVEK